MWYNIRVEKINTREWRNWQTRTFEGRVVHTVRVQVPFLAPVAPDNLSGATLQFNMRAWRNWQTR